MTEAPKRIWADGNDEWDTGCWGQHKEFDNDVEYIRADLVEAAIKRALEAAAEACEDLWIRADNDREEGYDEGLGAAMESIRRIDPAQFIEEEKG